MKTGCREALRVRYYGYLPNIAFPIQCSILQGQNIPDIYKSKWQLATQTCANTIYVVDVNESTKDSLQQVILQSYNTISTSRHNVLCWISLILIPIICFSIMLTTNTHSYTLELNICTGIPPSSYAVENVMIYHGIFTWRGWEATYLGRYLEFLSASHWQWWGQVHHRKTLVHACMSTAAWLGAWAA